MRGSDVVRALVAGVALAVAAAVHAQANFREAYARGKEAAANSRWSEVEARMREAIAAEPTPQARVRIYGMRFEPYVPQYFLGLAAYRQGNCAEAQRQWTHAPTAAVLAGDTTLQGVVEQGLADCRERQTQLAQQPERPAPPAGERAPTPAVAQREAAPPARAPSGDGARTAPTPTPRTATPSPAASPAAASTAPPALVAALEAFIAGRLDVPSELDPAPFGDKRARFHALLLRSAARHALAQADGERADALLAGATADIRAARALVPGQSPDAAVFSPRFRRLFDSTR
ncbi:MAG: hypothetical protein ACK59M_14425 [Pseudomonadota bacterium]